MNRLVWLLVLGALAAPPAAWSAVATRAPLIALLNTNHMKLGSEFAGKNILVYGIMKPGSDVVVKVLSPDVPVNLLRKTRVGPFWINSDRVTITGTPAIVDLLSSRPIKELVAKGGAAHWGFDLASALGGSVATPSSQLDGWRKALLRTKERGGYYRMDGHGVEIIGNGLFKAQFHLPSNMPLGVYVVEVYLLKDFRVIARQTLRLRASEGMDRHVVYAARYHPWLFGFVLSLLALFFGLFSSILLRKLSRI